MNTDLHPLVDDLSDSIDALTHALEPLLAAPLSTTSGKLPLLDKAKLHVLATYALESLLFSALRLHGQDAKAHPVFAELGRVKAYFSKISAAEGAGTAPSRTLDRDAATRFVKHGLAGNERYDRERAERGARERAGAKRKLEELSTGTHTRFEGVGKRMRAAEEEGTVKVVSAGDLEEGEEGEAEGGGVGGNVAQEQSKGETKRSRRAAKKERKRAKKTEERANEML